MEVTNHLPFACLYRRKILTRLLVHIRYSRLTKVEELGHVGVRSSHDAGRSELSCHNGPIADEEVQRSGDKHALCLKMEMSKMVIRRACRFERQVP